MLDYLSSKLPRRRCCRQFLPSPLFSDPLLLRRYLCRLRRLPSRYDGVSGSVLCIQAQLHFYSSGRVHLSLLHPCHAFV